MGFARFVRVSPFFRAGFRGFLRSCGRNGHEHLAFVREKDDVPFGGSAFLIEEHVRGRLDN